MVNTVFGSVYEGMTEDEMVAYFKGLHLTNRVLDRVADGDRLTWSDIEHIDFFETMVYLGILYDSDEWKLMEFGQIRILEETHDGVQIRATKTGPSVIRGELRSLVIWIPKFLLQPVI